MEAQTTTLIIHRPVKTLVKPCRHPEDRTVVNSTGGTHFSGGETWDDIREEVICLDCRGVARPPRKPVALNGHRGSFYDFRDLVDAYMDGKVRRDDPIPF